MGSGSWSRSSLLLFAAGDVVFDVAQRGFGQADGFPYSDVLYLLAYPVLAIALARLARSRYDRETAIDSIIVAIALSAVIWQWVVTPVLDSTSGASAERIVSVAYPIMDILLVVVIVHAVFTLPRWTPAAWLLFAGLGGDVGRPTWSTPGWWPTAPTPTAARSTCCGRSRTSCSRRR